MLSASCGVRLPTTLPSFVLAPDCTYDFTNRPEAVPMMTLTQSLPLVAAATCGARSVAVSGTLMSLGAGAPAETAPTVRNCETTAAAATS